LIYDHYGYTWSIRQILRTLKEMEESGEIKREQRKRPLGGGQWRQQTTLYRILYGAVSWGVALYWRIRWSLNNLRVTSIPFHHTTLRVRDQKKELRVSEKGKIPPGWVALASEEPGMAILWNPTTYEFVTCKM